jgi:hypothetical protein
MKAINNRVKRLENQAGIGDGLKRYIHAITEAGQGLQPSGVPPFTQEDEAKIKAAFDQLTEDELSRLAVLGG